MAVVPFRCDVSSGGGRGWWYGGEWWPDVSVFVDPVKASTLRASGRGK